jgi:hypothetical protein
VNRPQEQHVRDLGVDLEQRWWEGLRVRELAAAQKGAQPPADFLGLLAEALPDAYVSLRGVPAGAALVAGPSGLWLFAVRDWVGQIAREDGLWKQALKKDKLRTLEGAPDDQWVEQRESLAWLIQEGMPERAWTVGLIQGGVVFAHPKAAPDKARIRGNRAAYGSTRAWIERLRRAPVVDGFTPGMQLEILDALADSERKLEAGKLSARQEAERLYQAAAEELRTFVAELVAQPGRGNKGRRPRRG